MTAPLIITTPEELAALIRDAVAEVLAAQTPATPTPTLSATIYYSVPEFAALLHVSEGSIYTDIQRGKIPCTRVGRAIRIPETALSVYGQGGEA